MMKRTALLVVYNKDGILDLARFLAESGWNIVSTGGTAAFLRQNGIAITGVAEITSFAECLNGRVKTLHLHAGILARRGDDAHMNALAERSIAPIDIVSSTSIHLLKNRARGFRAANQSSLLILAMLRAPWLLVTHNPAEALLLGDRAVLFGNGVIAEEGASAALAHNPQTGFAARLFIVSQLGFLIGDAPPIRWLRR